MDFSDYILAALARDRLDELRRQARVCALAPRPARRRRVRLRLGAACVVLGNKVAYLGAALVAFRRRIGGDVVSTARP